MNPKLARLLNEGFSINTLEKLTPKQIGVLYSKINEALGSVKMAADKADPAKIKTLTDQGINVEIGENEEEDVSDVTKGEDDQNPIQKQGPDGMYEVEVNEKAVSKQQQKIMGLALSVKRGDTPKSKVSKKVQDMSKEISKKDLKDFASTKHKGLPKKTEKKDDVKKIEESIMVLIQNHLPAHTTKGELLKSLNKRKG
jgi:hypothetical protein